MKSQLEADLRILEDQSEKELAELERKKFTLNV